MSSFKVEYTKISKVYIHDNADALELANVDGKTWQFVIKKGEFKVGDHVIFFPVDSVLPKDLVDHLGIGNFLAGANHDRIKTVKLRKQISQGFVTSVQSILGYIIRFPETREAFQQPGYIENADYTSILGVIKYEPPAVVSKNADLVRLPGFVPSYDIEVCDNFPNIVEMLMDKVVVISEKLEGQNWGISIDAMDNVVVNQRNYALRQNGGEGIHTMIAVSEEEGWVDIVKQIKVKYAPLGTVAIRGEFLGPGVQSNIYMLKKHTIRIFEIELNGKPVGAIEMLGIAHEFSIGNVVPILSQDKTLREWLNGRTIQEASNGKSVLKTDILREGIVVKPSNEETVEGFGRLFIKMRSPEYLAKEA